MTRIDDGRFRVELVGGHAVVARRVLAATGLVDELPDIDGLAEHWGGDVIHCPFCHGYEVRDQRIVQIVTHPMGLHPAGAVPPADRRLTLVLHDGVDADDAELDALRAAGRRRRRRAASGASSPATTGTSPPSSWPTASASTPTPSSVGARFRVRAEPFASLGLDAGAAPDRARRLRRDRRDRARRRCPACTPPAT